MELLQPNFLDTTTAFTVQSNTVTASYLFRRDTSYQYVSSGYNNDLTTTSIVVPFSQTTTVSRIAIMGMNLKDFNIFYNGVTANNFVLTSGPTSASSFSSNSETSMYLQFAAIGVTSITFDLKKTTVANQEKAIGYLVVSDVRLEFPRLPSAQGYKPMIDPTDVVHRMSDGGTRIQTIADKWSANLKLNYISESARNSLYDIYRSHQEHIFCAFGTATGWDQVLFPCVWEGNFDFHEFSDNAVGAGFKGSMKLKEISY